MSCASLAPCFPRPTLVSSPPAPVAMGAFSRRPTEAGSAVGRGHPPPATWQGGSRQLPGPQRPLPICMVGWGQASGCRLWGYLGRWDPLALPVPEAQYKGSWSSSPSPVPSWRRVVVGPRPSAETRSLSRSGTAGPGVRFSCQESQHGHALGCGASWVISANTQPLGV